MSEPVPPGLYTQPPQGPPAWLPVRPLQASDPTVLTTGQVVPRQSMPVAEGGDAFSVDLDEAPRVLRELRQARDELQQVRMEALQLGRVEPGTNDEVSRDAAIVLGAVATGGAGSLLQAVDGGINRLGQLIGDLESELAAYEVNEQGVRDRLT